MKAGTKKKMWKWAGYLTAGQCFVVGLVVEVNTIVGVFNSITYEAKALGSALIRAIGSVVGG